MLRILLIATLFLFFLLLGVTYVATIEDYQPGQLFVDIGCCARMRAEMLFIQISEKLLSMI